MARSLRWTSTTAGFEVELTDYIGLLGPLRTFSLSQLTSGGKPLQKWELVSSWIPCKTRRQTFTTIEGAQHAAQTIVDKFSDWIAAGAR